MLQLLSVLLFGVAAAESPPVLVRYTVTERTRSVTPAGERISALAGTICVAGDRARWELAASSFPRASATIALADRGAITLLNPKLKVAADIAPSELPEVFRAPAAEETGSSSFGSRGLTISVTRDGAGRLFQESPTARWRVALNWDLTVETPGRVGRVKNEVRGVVECLEAAGDARTPFDDLVRLFPVRGDVREALEKELTRIHGLPVSVSIDVTSEVSSEVVGGASGGAGSARPLKTTTNVTRTVSSLTRQPLRPDEATLFRVPEGYRSRGLSYLTNEGPALP